MASNNILQAKVTIQGTRALLWHAFGPDAMPLEKQERTGVAGNDPEEWKKTVLMLPETRQLYVKPTYVFGTIRDGAKHTKRGRGTIQSFVAATLQVTDNFVLVDRFVPQEPVTQDPTAPVYLDIQGVKNPATKGRNVRYRIAAAPGWSATFNLEWDKTIVSRGEMEAVVIDAGRFTGIGDGRNVGYGRFSVISFEVENAA
jgi:hypothetical protein